MTALTEAEIRDAIRIYGRNGDYGEPIYTTSIPRVPGPGSSPGPDAFGFQYDSGREA
ncbi:MAG TPA: hypothetical protein VIM30_18430 [Candidatus Limnocylindrales bacterium]|jgi:hypothetical protein